MVLPTGLLSELSIPAQEIIFGGPMIDLPLAIGPDSVDDNDDKDEPQIVTLQATSTHV